MSHLTRAAGSWSEEESLQDDPMALTLHRYGKALLGTLDRDEVGGGVPSFSLRHAKTVDSETHAVTWQVGRIIIDTVLSHLHVERVEIFVCEAIVS